jgi:hypothetical protein
LLEQADYYLKTLMNYKTGSELLVLFYKIITITMKTAIVWFKTDLRLEDNEALLKAILTATSAACLLF